LKALEITDMRVYTVQNTKYNLQKRN